MFGYEIEDRGGLVTTVCCDCRPNAGFQCTPLTQAEATRKDGTSKECAWCGDALVPDAE